MSMCRVFSCVGGRGCLLWAVHFLGKTLSVFALLHSIFQGKSQNLPTSSTICRLNLHDQLGRLCVYGIYKRSLRAPTKENALVLIAVDIGRKSHILRGTIAGGVGAGKYLNIWIWGGYNSAHNTPHSSMLPSLRMGNALPAGVTQKVWSTAGAISGHLLTPRRWYLKMTQGRTERWRETPEHRYTWPILYL